MLASPRCGAHSRRSGKPCRSPAVRGKTGEYTREAIAEYREVGRLIHAVSEGLGDIEDLLNK